jgi:single-strand DNA-binding protein
MTDNNVLSINGRLTKDAELRFSSSGTAILTFSIASNHSVKNGDSWTDEASFFDAKMFGNMANSVARFLEKGKQVSLLGEIRQERWEKDGKQNSKVVIIVNKLQLLGSKDEAPERKPVILNTPENFHDDSEAFVGDSIPF